MKLALRRRGHRRPLTDELRGQAHRQLGRQLQLGEIEGLATILVRRAAERYHQLVALDGKLLLQWRQRGLGLGERSFTRPARRRARRHQDQLPAHDPSESALDANDILGAPDLGVQGRDVDHGRTTCEVRVR